MGRIHYQPEPNAARTGLTVIDTAGVANYPAAPSLSTPVAGVGNVSGATALAVDVFVPTGGSGATTFTVLAWNPSAQLWFVAGTATANGAGQVRTVIPNWGSGWAYCSLTAISASVGSGVACYVGSLVDTG